MKIAVCHVLSDSNLGGAGVFIRNLVSASECDLFSYRVLLPRGATLPAEVLREAGAEVIFGDFEGERSLSLGLFLSSAKLLHRSPPDILHTHGSYGAALAAALPRISIPILSTLHCALAPRATALTRNFPARFWAATSGEAERLLHLRGVPEARLRLITNGSPALSRATATERADARRALGLGDADFAIGISARLEPIKSHATLLLALAELIRREKPVVAILIGDGSQREALASLARHLGIADRVIFTGFVREVRRIYCALDAHVNCSLGSETSCLALSETMSMAIPQAVSDCAGNLELSGGGRAALVFARGDYLALAERLSLLIDSSDTREKYSAAAESEYSERLGIGQMARKYEKYYLDILSHSF